MIYETILSGSLTDLGFFDEIKGDKDEPDIKTIIYELNYLYKYNKKKWIEKKQVRNLELKIRIIYI
jgi:hypothetical protein